MSSRSVEERMQEPQDDSYSSESPSLAFTVNVKVEAVDETNEDEAVTVETEPCDADGDEKYREKNTDMSIISKVTNNGIRPAGTCLMPKNVYKIDKTKVFEELDKISTATDDVADKMLATEVRNTWGHSFFENHTDSVMNHKISVCLGKWLAWSSFRGIKDTPVAYKCYVCSLGWWYLGPFRDHVNSNHKDIDLNIYLEIADCESAMVANVKDSEIRTVIRIHGACPKCGRDADCHKVLNYRDIFLKYRCPYCVETFETCSLWSRHMGSCWKYLDYVQTSPAIDKLYTCHLCGTAREGMELIEEHYIYSHSVRSDVLAYEDAKTCPNCGQLTPCLLTHPCPVSKPAGFCSFCLKRFSTLRLLELHEAINNRPTRCPLCKETLPSKCSLVAHMAKSHSDNYLLVPKCVLCVEHTVFLNERSKKTHVSLHHLEKYDRRRHGLSVIIPKTCITSYNIPPPKFPTTTCNDSLTVKQYNSKQVYCTSCDKHYENLEQYCEHFEIKHGFEWHQCPICKRSNLKETFVPHFERHVVQTFVRVKSLIHTANGSKLNIEYKCHRCLEKVGIDSMLAHWEIHYSRTLSYEANSDDAKPTDKTESDKNDVLENKCVEEDIEKFIAANDSLTYNTIAPTNTQNTTDIDTSPSDTLIRIVEVCGNYYEDVNTSSQFPASSQLCTEQIEEGIEDSSMDHEERITEDEVAVEIETIVKVEEIMLKKDNTIEHEERINKEEMDVESETIAKEKEIYDHDSTMNYESASDYTPLHSYFCIKKGVVDCKRCQNQFTSVEYQLHLQYCSERVYCTSCDKHYENMEHYCEHFETEHGFKQHQCPICKDCNLKETFISHFKRHVVDTFVPVRSLVHIANGTKSKQHIEYKCERCLKRVRADFLLVHWEMHYSRTLCKPTNKTDSNKNYVDKNKRDKEDIEKVVVTLQTPADDRWDLRNGSNVDTKHACVICKKICLTESALKIHLIEHLLRYAFKKCASPDALQCPICKVYLTKANQFRLHMRIHGSVPSYTCTVCEQQFSCSTNLSSHQKTHMLLCKACGKNFTQDHHLREHLEICKVNRTDMKDHYSLPLDTCSVCKKKFADSSSLANHQKIHNPKIWPCEVCGKKFKQNYLMRRHLKRHLPDSIRCSCCNRLFFDESSYREHLKAAELKKIRLGFRCPLCNLIFSNKKILKEHAWNEHILGGDEADCRPMCKQSFS